MPHFFFFQISWWNAVRHLNWKFSPLPRCHRHIVILNRMHCNSHYHTGKRRQQLLIGAPRETREIQLRFDSLACYFIRCAKLHTADLLTCVLFTISFWSINYKPASFMNNRCFKWNLKTDTFSSGYFAFDGGQPRQLKWEVRSEKRYGWHVSVNEWSWQRSAQM